MNQRPEHPSTTRDRAIRDRITTEHNRDRAARPHEAESAIARRGAHTRDPRAVGTDPTARRPRDTKPATPDA